MKREFRNAIKIAATITDDVRRNALLDHLIDHICPESDLRAERWLRFFSNFTSCHILAVIITDPLNPAFFTGGHLC